MNIDGDGITKFHQCYITANTLRYRKVSYCCSSCCASAFKRQCNKTAHAGRWRSVVRIASHPTYGKLAADYHKNKSDNAHNTNSNNKVEFIYCLI